MVNYKVGDKVRILHASKIESCKASDGDVLEVISIDGYGDPVLLDVNGTKLSMYRYELAYVELVSEEAHRITTLEKANADMLNEIKALTSRITALEEAKPKASTIGSSTLTVKAGIDTKKMSDLISKAMRQAFGTTQTPNQRRKAVIERAKAFVEDVERKSKDCTVRNVGNSFLSEWLTLQEYHVNKEKRVVTVVVRKHRGNNDFLTKAIARCSPDDVFNVHIGKAIALAKAYGLEVPREFTHAPQPEIAVGQVVRNEQDFPHAVQGPVSKGDKFTVVSEPPTNTECGMFSAIAESATIIDDSEALYDE